ncbi:hypothetical protein [Streptomyces inhibens]|uniref:hypothetical protein n=1 Tax=Streptomyces inhibens TaxID=2293571 RepID=UPI0015F27D58|nr:hypothetical protein [Streptomyces inhibens]
MGIAGIRSLDGSCEVVVAADGLNSTARTALFGLRYRARYIGASSWRGTVDGETGSVTETWGEGLGFGVTPASGSAAAPVKRSSTEWGWCGP